jgi:antitoxin VapB
MSTAAAKGKEKGQKPFRRTAKLFRNGRSQAVRLPAEFRFDCDEVFIRQDSITGDVILSRRPESWESFFELRSETIVPEEFLADREDVLPQKRPLFS